MKNDHRKIENTPPPINTVVTCHTDTYPLGLPSLCGILIETAFSNVDCKTSSVALKARLFTTSVLQAAPAATGREERKETGEPNVEIEVQFLWSPGTDQ